MALAKLSIEIEAELAKFKQSLDGVGAQVQRATSGWAKSFGPLTAAFSALTASVSAAGFLALAKGATDALDALNDVKDATGASIGNISALEDLALRTGGSLETVETSLLRLNAALRDTDPDGRAAKALQAIGISAAQLQKEDPAEALRQVAVQLGKFADDGNKARLVQELFGKSSKEVAAFLHDLAEQQRLVAVTGADATGEAEAFNKQIFELQANVTQLARNVTGDLLPALNNLIDDFKRGDFGAFGFGGEEYKLRQQLEHLRGVARDARADAEEAARSSAGFNLLKFGTTELAEMLRRVGAAQIALDGFEASYFKFTNAAGAGRGFVNPDPILPSVGSIDSGKKDKKPASIKPAVSEFDKYLEQLRQAQVRVADLSTLEQAQYDIARGALGQLSLASQAIVLTEAHRVDAARDVAEVQREWAAAFDELDRRQQNARDQAAQVWQSLLTPTERYAQELEKVASLVKSGAFGDPTDPAVRAQIDEINKRMAQLDPKVIEAEDKARTLAQETAGFFKDLVHNINDADDVLQKFLARMADRALDNLFKGLEDSLAQFFKAAGGGSGASSLSTLGRFIGGAFADGGRPPMGKVSLVGERGPELFVPDGAGTIVPLKPVRAAGANGQAVTVNIVQHIGQGVSRAEVAAAGQQIREQVKADILRSMRRGGSFAQ